jgi:uncharacterized CHY-type Zn-finger protein
MNKHIGSNFNDFYNEEILLICPNCKRKMPSIEHRRKHGCKWCTPKNNTEFCNGKYS